MSECPVTCAMHARAVRWLTAGDWRTLREFLPVFQRMRAGAWRQCACDLFNRVLMSVRRAERG